MASCWASCMASSCWGPYHRLAGNEQGVCSSCSSSFRPCVLPKLLCEDCKEAFCSTCMTEAGSVRYAAILSCGLVAPARCRSCDEKAQQKNVFFEVTLPRLQAGASFAYVEKQGEAGWLKLSEDKANLQWASLRQILNRPKCSEAVPMLQIQSVETGADGQTLTVRLSTKDGSAWYKSKSKAILRLKANSKNEAKTWHQDLTAAIEFLIPKLRAEQGDDEKLANMKERMEQRQKDRQKQLKDMGDVGMKFTSQIMMSRSK